MLQYGPQLLTELEVRWSDGSTITTQNTHNLFQVIFNQSTSVDITERENGPNIQCHTLSFHDTEVTESVSLDKSHRRVTCNSHTYSTANALPLKQTRFTKLQETKLLTWLPKTNHLLVPSNLTFPLITAQYQYNFLFSCYLLPPMKMIYNYNTCQFHKYRTSRHDSQSWQATLAAKNEREVHDRWLQFIISHVTPYTNNTINPIIQLHDHLFYNK